MALIRIFKTRGQAEWAKEVLEEGGIKAWVKEDKFNEVPIQNYGVRARFRVIVDDLDYNRAALYLANKLRKRIS